MTPSITDKEVEDLFGRRAIRVQLMPMTDSRAEEAKRLLQNDRRQRLTAGMFGIVIAISLLGFTVLLTPSTASLTWSGSMSFGGVGPREVGSGGPIGPTNCTTLHVQFNASGPIEVWVAPGHADLYYNSTIWFTQYWISIGPAPMGEFVVHIPSSSTGYRVVLFNPSWNVTIPSMQFETSETSC